MLPPSEEQLATQMKANGLKKENDRQRGRTRVCMDVSLPRWRALKEEKCLRGDKNVALFLLLPLKFVMSNAKSTLPKLSTLFRGHHTVYHIYIHICLICI